jgi:hypothetical protein
MGTQRKVREGSEVPFSFRHRAEFRGMLETVQKRRGLRDMSALLRTAVEDFLVREGYADRDEIPIYEDRRGGRRVP